MPRSSHCLLCEQCNNNNDYSTDCVIFAFRSEKQVQKFSYRTHARWLSRVRVSRVHGDFSHCRDTVNIMMKHGLNYIDKDMTNSYITVSAPGKVLLAGGYLVLEPTNVGLVIAVDKRVYTTVKVSRAEGEVNDIVKIQVESPQFGQVWNYSYDRNNAQLIESNNRSNEFIEKTLRVSLLYLIEHEHSVQSIDMSIQADNDFYSLITHLKERSLPINLQNALSLPRFLPASVDETSGKVFKSGLGSSACLVTSMVGALCHAFNRPGQIFNLAQISHCYAQGKVGSGFDVSAACHGSHVYQRFPEIILNELLSTLEAPSGASSIQPSLKNVVESTWPGGVAMPIKMGGFLQVFMADVSGGSESPSMARSVLAWKRKQEGKGRIIHWQDLIDTNQQIVDVWQQLMGLPSLTNEEVSQLANCNPGLWNDGQDGWTRTQKEAGHLTAELRRLFSESRRHLKLMGEAAGVPIEPDEQTALADATLGLPGVVTALVPGAGGYDALACLYINSDEVRQRIGETWANWSNATVCPLTVQAVDYEQGVKVETDIAK